MFPHMVIIFALVSKDLLFIPEMFALVLVLILHASVVLRPAHLKSGALTRDLGRVYLVEDALWVTYPHVSLMEIPGWLRDVARSLKSTLWRLKKNDSFQSEVMLSLLHVRIQYVNDTITSALENNKGLTVTNRTKRGLIDGIGKLSQMLFGTAMNKDVVELRDRYNQLVRLEKQVAELAAYTYLLHISISKVRN